VVKKNGQPPRLPESVPVDATHEAANALHSAALRLLRRASVSDAGMRLDGPRASALSVLVYAGEMPIGRLAGIEQVTPPAITKTVTALESDGLATRVRSATDRRVVVVRATDAGRALIERGRAARVLAVGELLAPLGPRDRDTLLRAATIVLSLLEERPAQV
jgi:DNA-binding MarR family transcriptional regulator